MSVEAADRFEELLSRLFDGELTDTEAGALTALLRDHPPLRSELRQHLVIWELWSQQKAPERSADAFVAACHTRLRAERQGDSFLASLRERLPNKEHEEQRGASLWWWLRRPASLAGAISFLTAAAAILFWFVVLPHRAVATVTLHGEAVCTACILHETHEHRPAIRVTEGGRTRIYYVKSDRHPFERAGDFCSAPVPLVVTGRAESKDGRLEMEASSVQRDSAPDSPAGPILFPF